MNWRKDDPASCRDCSHRGIPLILLAGFAALPVLAAEPWEGFPVHRAGLAGSIDLPVSSACLLRVDQKQTRRVEGLQAPLLVRDGALVRWDAEAGRLAWKLEIPSNGTYAVTAFLGPDKGRDCTLSLAFAKDGKETRLNAVLSGDCGLRPEEEGSAARCPAGEVKLTAGACTLLVRPTQWIHPFEMANLIGFRLQPKGATPLSQPLAAPSEPVPGFVSGPPETLYAVGDLDQLPPQFAAPEGARFEYALRADPQAGFPERNRGEALAALARRLRGATLAGAPGLEAFDRACAAQDWPRALAAYRDAFFARLKRPERFDALTENIVKEHLFGRGKGFLLKRPDPEALRLNKAGYACSRPRGEAVTLRVGAPGSVAWTPGLRPPDDAQYGRSPDSHPWWKTAEGKDLARQIEACRMMKFLPADSDMFLDGGFFPALLHAYAVDGDQEALALWCAYLDDFAMRALDQYARYPVSIRAATELETQQFRVLLMFWRILLDERPEFARDFEPATLARFLLFATKEYPAYTIRAKRAEQANWGIMGICDLAHLCRFFPEFRVMRYAEKETWRLWQANFFQHRTPDGENIEAWDTGHNAIDIEYARHAAAVMPPRWAGQEETTDYLDQIRVNQRSLLTHLTPDGQYWPSWLPEGRELENDVRHRWLREGWLDLILHEPEAQRRIEATLTGAPGPLGWPRRRSDYAPHAAMAYLREGWGKTDAMWIFQNFQTRSQGLTDCGNTAAMLVKNGRILAEVHPLAINGRPPNRFWGKTPTGGKTGFSGQADLGLAGGRFFSHDLFDFVEGVQDHPYASPTRPDRFDVTGLYRADGGGADDAAAIHDTRVIRQVFWIPSAGLSVISDRVDTSSVEVRDYAQFVVTPILFPAKSLEVWVREVQRSNLFLKSGFPFLMRGDVDLTYDGHRIRHNDLVNLREDRRMVETALYNTDNVRIAFGMPPEARMMNRLDRTGVYQKDPVSALDALAKAFESGKSQKWIEDNLDRQPVGIHFSCAGPAVFAHVLAIPARREDDPVLECTGGGKEPVQITAKNSSSVRVHFRRSVGSESVHEVGPFRIRAETVLIVEDLGRWSGLVLNGSEFHWERRALELPGPDVAFTHPEPGIIQFDPAPGQPVLADPLPGRPSVFTDSAQGVLPEPPLHAEWRYTLHGEEPSLDSPKYDKPFSIDRTTLVKARPFRRGLTETPWHFDGVTAGRTQSVLMEKKPWKEAAPVAAANLEPGLDFEYLEGDWTSVFLLAGEEGLLPVSKRGVLQEIFDGPEVEAIRATDGAYGLVCTGYLRAAADGIYTVKAPRELYNTIADAGYDLRVWIDGEEWSPCPRPQGRDTWSVPLRAGWHRLRVVLADYRERPFRNDFWMPWRPEQMTTGLPELEIEGPDGRVREFAREPRR